MMSIGTWMYGRAYPLIRASPWLGRTLLRCLPDWRMHLQVEPIGLFYIRLRQHRSYWLRHPFQQEEFSVAALRHMVHPGDVYYDVGANIGVFVRFVGGTLRAGRVICFEPVPANLELLERNIKAGGISHRVDIFPVALSDEEGEEEFQLDDISSQSGCLSSVSNGDASESRRHYGLGVLTQKVNVASLDALIQRERLPIPNVIKIDIEGAEGAMLRGARHTLQIHGPRLLIELHGLDRAKEVLQVLSEVGYRSFGYIRIGGHITYKEVTLCDLEQLTDQYDLHRLLAAKDTHDIQEPPDRK